VSPPRRAPVESVIIIIIIITRARHPSIALTCIYVRIRHVFFTIRVLVWGYLFGASFVLHGCDAYTGLEVCRV